MQRSLNDLTADLVAAVENGGDTGPIIAAIGEALPDTYDCDEAHLDQWIADALDAEIAEMDSATDFDAGLADVYARSNRT